MKRNTNQISHLNEAELLSLQKELTRTREQLAELEKMASLGELTAGLAHEITNPVNFVNGNSIALAMNLAEIEPLFEKLLSLDDVQGEAHRSEEIQNLVKDLKLGSLWQETQDLLEGIKRGNDRIQQIIQSLRIFSHPGAGKLTLLDVHESLDTSLLILSNKILSANLTVKKNYGEIPEISCFASKISQVFMNLLDNAIHASPVGGQMVLATYPKNGWICVSVQDYGKGMDSRLLEKVFDPFFSTKAAGKGTGLGLSISREIIEAHHGTIEVHSQMGQGTEFVVNLPVDSRA